MIEIQRGCILSCFLFCRSGENSTPEACRTGKFCLIRAAADCGHDANLAVATDCSLQSLISTHDLTVHKNVDVRADLSLFSQDPITQPRMPAPELTQRVADALRVALDLDLRLAAGEFSQIT